MLTQREKNILHYLQNKEYCTAKRIAEHLGVSERTVRSDILSINSSLKDIASVTAESNCGYHLYIYDKELFNSELKESQIPDSPEERVNFIIKLFLNEDRYIKTESIAELLCQSSSTITADLKQVRKILQKYNLILETKPKYGLKIKGEEKDLRKLQSDHIFKRRSFSHDQMREKIVNILNNTLSKYHYSVSEFAFNNLVIHLEIAVSRVQQGNLINVSQDDVKDTLELKIAREIAEQIDETLNIKLPNNECHFISMHLLGKKLHNDSDNTVIPREYEEIIQRTLNQLSEEFKINLSDDLNLKLALTLHMIPLSYRLKYDLRMENPLLDSIKANYPHAYIIAMSLAHELSLFFGKKLSSDEIGFLALHINLSMEKRYADTRKRNIILVCATGRGTAKLLEHQYRQKFGQWINELICIDATNLKYQNFENIDLIFTTVPILEPVPVPVIETGFILDTNEAMRIESSIDGNSSLKRFFPKELFFKELKLNTQKEIISFLIDNASKIYKLPDNFEELIWKREESFSTAFANGVALPHPYSQCTEDTFTSVALLDKPVVWGDKKVQIVIMISLSKKEDPEISDYYIKLSKLLVNDSLLKRLSKESTYESLMNILNQIK